MMEERFHYLFAFLCRNNNTSYQREVINIFIFRFVKAVTTNIYLETFPRKN